MLKRYHLYILVNGWAWVGWAGTPTSIATALLLISYQLFHLFKCWNEKKNVTHLQSLSFLKSHSPSFMSNASRIHSEISKGFRTYS